MFTKDSFVRNGKPLKTEHLQVPYTAVRKCGSLHYSSVGLYYHISNTDLINSVLFHVLWPDVLVSFIISARFFQEIDIFMSLETTAISEYSKTVTWFRWPIVCIFVQRTGFSLS